MTPKQALSLLTAASLAYPGVNITEASAGTWASLFKGVNPYDFSLALKSACRKPSERGHFPSPQEVSAELVKVMEQKVKLPAPDLVWNDLMKLAAKGWNQDKVEARVEASVKLTEDCKARIIRALQYVGWDEIRLGEIKYLPILKQRFINFYNDLKSHDNDKAKILALGATSQVEMTSPARDDQKSLQGQALAEIAYTQEVVNG